MAVAAASILAREAFVNWMSKGAEQWEISLALGAGPPVLEAGRAFLERHGVQELRKVAKVHFKTTNQLTDSRIE